MAVHSNRSPSPLGARPNSNPNPRNSTESISGFRRSFSGNPSARPSVFTNPRSLNPVTPANSPSDWARRRSVGIGGMSSLKQSEEKENCEKEQSSKAAKLRSPVKGSKNFMSPTISAASKFTPSPRKNVLVERNDPLRTSASLSDGKFAFFAPNSEECEQIPEMILEPKETLESSLNSRVTNLDGKGAILPVPKPLKKVTFLEDSLNVAQPSSDTVIIDSDCVELDSNSKNNDLVSSSNNNPSSNASPAIAPLDADPSMPPYDPKTNFLSPRPQFLRYKPNPRIEIFINKQMGHSLEESFMSDAEGTEDSQTEDSCLLDAESMEESKSNDTPEEKCDDISLEEMAAESEEKEEEPYISSESLQVSTPVTDGISEDLEAKGDKKPRAFGRMKYASLLLVILIACVSLCAVKPPAIDMSKINDLRFTSLYDQSRNVLAEVKLEEYMKHLQEFSANSLFYASKIFEGVGSEGQLGTLEFMNLTDSHSDIVTACGTYVDNHEGNLLAKDNEDEEEDVEAEIELFEDEPHSEYLDADQNIEQEPEEPMLEIEVAAQASAILTTSESGSSESMQNDEVAISNSKAETQTETNLKEKLATKYLALETKSDHEELENNPQIVESEGFQGVYNLVPGAPVDHASVDRGTSPASIEMSERTQTDNEAVSCPKAESQNLTEDKLGTVLQSHETKSHEEVAEYKPQFVESEEVQSVKDFLSDANVDDGTSINYETSPAQAVPHSRLNQAEDSKHVLLIIGISSLTLLGGAAAFIFRLRGSPTMPDVEVKSDTLLSKKTVSVSAYQGNPPTENWPTEVDVVGESCPSEMSSFQKSSSYSKTAASEAQSYERRPRKYSKRESLASSDYSMGSPSYGSFTTYERIPIKSVKGDSDDIITPVRRSSRIRNQVTSP